MKKEIKTAKNNRTMTSKSVPKHMQSILSSFTDFVVGIAGDVMSVDESTVAGLRQAMVDHQDDLLKILKDNMHQREVVGKKVKDPDAPKRGKSSYIYFCVEKRDEIKKANPNMSAKEIIKELGRVWRENVSEKDKARYEKLSTDDKARYDTEMKDYTPPPNVGNVFEKKDKRVGPKRGLTGYIYFCKEQRSVLKEEDSKLSTKEITAELGKRWRELSEKDRKPFAKLAAKDKARYETEKESWVDPETGSENESAPKKKKKKKGKAKSSEKKEAKHRRKSGYILYCQDSRAALKDANSDWTSQQITKELGRKWKELSEAEQAVFNERAASEIPEESKVVKTKPAKKEAKKEVKKPVKKAEPESEQESDLEELVDDEDSD